MGLLAVTLTFLAGLTYSMSSVSDCSNGLSLFKLTSMSFSPDPTVAGENSTLLLSMTVPEQIEDGTATYDTTYNFIPFSPTVDPLCEAVVCPIKTGVLDTVSSYPISNDLTGSLILKITWRDSLGKLLMCVSVRTTLGDATKQLVYVPPRKFRRHRGNITNSSA